MFLKIRRRSSLSGFDWEEDLEKDWGNGKKQAWAESGIFVFAWEGEKKITALKLYCNHFKVYKKCKSPIQKKN